MIMRIITGSVCLLIGLAAFADAESIDFKSNSKSKDGSLLVLTGELLKPDGDGPFPAAVLVHGGAGKQTNHTEWAHKLVSWGYVTFQVDSLSPRGKFNICDPSMDDLYVRFLDRAQDAHDAKSYLAGLAFVDKNRIAVVGWSHGAGTILKAIDPDFNIKDRGNPFSAAVAFYPYCHNTLAGFEAPLLILIGEKDKLCPAALCRRQIVSKKVNPEVVLKIYPNAHHSFDRFKLDKDATSDAVVRVKSFLTKHMH